MDTLTGHKIRYKIVKIKKNDIIFLKMQIIINNNRHKIDKFNRKCLRHVIKTSIILIIIEGNVNIFFNTNTKGKYF